MSIVSSVYYTTPLHEGVELVNETHIDSQGRKHSRLWQRRDEVIAVRLAENAAAIELWLAEQEIEELLGP